MKRWLIGIGVAAALVVVALVVFLFTGLDAAVKRGIEHYGSEATGTDVALADVEIALTSGQGTLRDLEVANPKGFSTPYAFELGLIRVRIEPASVTRDVVAIREIAIENPHVWYELGSGGSNIGVIQDNVEAFGKRFGGGSSERQVAADEASGKRFVIDELDVTGGRVDVKADFVEKAEKRVALPEIHLRDIGKEKGGATGAEVATEVVTALTRSALQAAAQAGLKKYDKELERRLGTKGLGDLLGGILGK